MAAAPRDDGWDPTRSVAGPYDPWLIVFVISIPTFMEVLDTSIANVSLNHIAGALAISSDQATWVVSSYLVANAILIPISGWLNDIIGRKRYFMISIALFTASSFLCGSAPDLTTLVVARVLQGIGGGGLAPVMQSMLADTFPPKQRGMAFAAFAVVAVVGPVLGPTLGGYLTEYASWHWIFLINVPIGIISLVLIHLFVDEPETIREERRERFRRGIRFDYLGIILVALGLGFLELTLDRGEREDWFASSFIVMTASVAAVSLISLVIWELSVEDPVVDLRLLKNRNFAIAIATMGVVGMVMFSTTQIIPQMLQQVMGYSSFQAGLALTTASFATLAAVPFAGRLTGRVDGRWLLFPALLAQALALWHMTTLNADISFADAAWARTLQTMTFPFLFVPISTVAYVGLPQSKTSQASSLFNVARNLGGTIGIAFSQSLLAGGLQRHQAQLVENLNPLNPNYTEWMAKADLATGGNGNPMAMLYGEVQHQATMLSFIDVFWALLVMILLVSPLILFLRPAGAGGPVQGMVH